MSAGPYSDLPDTAFWRASVADRHPFDLAFHAPEPLLRPKDRVATAGSCFAQHIGAQLKRRGAGYVDLEPRPNCVGLKDSARFGYGLFSCRYGNVYTTRQLLQLLQEVMGHRQPGDRVWIKDGRYYDALRPSVDPVGHDSADDVLLLRELHLRRVRQLLSSINVFVFTLGLTETWASKADGTVFPSAPGTIAGTWDPSKYAFVNLRYREVMEDLKDAISLLRSFNSTLRVILTVSPVPLKATASGAHVLVANSQSKSTLRAVAGDITEDDALVSYFPSYELIASHPMRAMFFNPDLRSVNPNGVEYVMSKFFGTPSDGGVPRASNTVGLASAEAGQGTHFDLICDEEANDQG